MNERGFSMIELMGYSALLGLFALSTVGISSRLYRASQTATAYSDDVSQCRRALRQLDVDLRRASRVEDNDGVVILSVGAATIRYRISDGVLTRQGASNTRVIARRIASLQVSTSGRLATLRLQLQKRASGRVDPAVIESTVCMSGGSR